MSYECETIYGEIDRPQREVLNFIKENNGDAYRGDEETARFIGRAAYTLGIYNTSGTLGGVALVDRTRLLTWTTSKTAWSELGFSSRAELGVHFMRCCGEHARWLTIGEEYTRALAVAAISGLERVKESAIVEDILGRDGLLGQYNLTSDEDGELIIETVGSGNRQQMWQYPTAMDAG